LDPNNSGRTRPQQLKNTDFFNGVSHDRGSFTPDWMAEAVAHWIRDDIEPAIAAVGAALPDVEVFGSFECRSFYGTSEAHLSEHGHANALDIRSFKLANGTLVELTNPTASKPLRE
jgi:hypothetical protein